MTLRIRRLRRPPVCARRPAVYRHRTWILPRAPTTFRSVWITARVACMNHGRGFIMRQTRRAPCPMLILLSTANAHRSCPGCRLQRVCEPVPWTQTQPAEVVIASPCIMGFHGTLLRPKRVLEMNAGRVLSRSAAPSRRFQSSRCHPSPACL